MKTRKLILTILLYVFGISLAAQTKENTSIDIDFAFVSNYVWRGFDFFRNYALQKQKPYSSNNYAWAFQPSITWNTPVEGLYVNLFSSLALIGRKDIDIDQRIQTEPNGSFIASRTSLIDYLVDPTLDITTDIASELPTSGNILDYQSTPNFYKEPVGLHRNDEVDITIGYSKETSKGTIGFGILQYSYANPVNKGVYGTEVFVSYAPPFLRNLEFSIYNDFQVFTQYYKISYSGEYQLSDSLTSSYSISLGHYVFDKIQGISDVTLTYRIDHSSGLYVGINASYRPDLKIHEYYWGSGDPILEEAYTTKLPIEINGLSTIYDGLVPDPSKNLGPVNEYINGLISGSISSALGIPYTYIPRQKLPRYLWWISLGYAISL